MRVSLYEYFQHLENPSEKNLIVPCADSDDKLPSPRTEALALLRIVSRNGNGLDSLESMRKLIRVEETVKQMMLKNTFDEKEVRRMLQFRERVLEVFDQEVAKRAQ